MQYLSVEEARHEPGLKLVLTAGVPGPWSESAKALFGHHNIDYLPVRQFGGQENPELLAWTRHRNAPIALYEQEAPRVRWLEILDLAERLGSSDSLYPTQRDERIYMVGLINEIAGENGFGWNARLLMLDAWHSELGEKAFANPMFKDYQYDPERSRQAINDTQTFLTYLANRIRENGDYLVEDRLSAADIYWAYFSNLISPQPQAVNPMPDSLRQSYELPGKVLGGIDDVLIAHRDRIFERHLKLPLTF